VYITTALIFTKIFIVPLPAILNAGLLSKASGKKYEGGDRFKCRERL
jgi:hypothetical protein